jgi:hypothetical protein
MWLRLLDHCYYHGELVQILVDVLVCLVVSVFAALVVGRMLVENL